MMPSGGRAVMSISVYLVDDAIWGEGRSKPRDIIPGCHCNLGDR